MKTMKRKRVCKKQVSMEQEQGRREGEGAKWVTHYSSDHQILLVGEGDFSFSFSLARSYGSAANIVASSLDSYDDLKKKYKQAKSNLDGLQKLGACLLHGVDATKMKFHSDLKMRRFDRVIFNFPHAGFHGKEDDLAVIKMHKDLVLGFFKNASQMLTANGEIHVNHKTSSPFNKWDIEELAMQSFLTLIERADFHKEDYPAYNNKRGDSNRCDEPFPLGRCSTFKFIYNPRAVGKAKTRQRKSPTTSVDLNCYPQPSHPSKFNDTVASLLGLPNGYTPNTIYHLLNNVEHRRDAPCAGYSSNRGMNPVSQRLLQPMQPLKPMESLNSFQPWPTSTNVRHSQTNHVRTMDTVPLSLGTRNGGCQIIRGTSNYLQEARGGTSQSAHGGTNHGMNPSSQRLLQPMQPLKPMESLNSFQPWPTSTNVRHSQTNHVRTMDTVPLSLGTKNEGCQIFRGTSNYLQEACGGTSQSAHGGTNHGTNPSSQRLLQPMQPLKLMESLNSFQPWPTSANVRHSQTNHVRTMDTVPLSLGTKNEGCQIFRGTSNYLQEARGGTSQSAHGGTCLRSSDRALPELKSHNSQLHSRATVHSELPRTMEDRRAFVAHPHNQPSTRKVIQTKCFD